MRTVKRCNGEKIKVNKVEISGDSCAWDIWYYSDTGECVFGLEVEKDLEEIKSIENKIYKWIHKYNKHHDDLLKFNFTINYEEERE